MRSVAYLALAAMMAWGGYVWGWYRGLTYHTVVSGMSEAKWSMSAARSLRQNDPDLALELLEDNIAWMDLSLRQSAPDVPAQERGNYEIVLRQLQEYRDEFAGSTAGQQPTAGAQSVSRGSAISRAGGALRPAR